MYIAFPHHLYDSVFAAGCCIFRQVDGVRTHISDKSGFVQTLCDHHRLCYGISQFACRFLLQGGSCEWSRRCFLYRTGGYIFNRKSRSLTCVKECFCFFFRLDTAWQFRFHFYQLAVCIGNQEYGNNPVSGFWFERMNFAFTFYNQADSYRLYASCRQRWFNFSPKYRRQFKTYNSIQDSSCLLCIYEVEVDIAWLLDCF